MPIYEYECSNCGKITSVLQKINDEAPTKCTWCQKEGSLHKRMSHSSFILKGGGWFKDCYPDAKSSGTSVEEHHHDNSNSNSTSTTPQSKPECSSCPHKDCPSNTSTDQ